MPAESQQTAPMWIDVTSLDPNMPDNLFDKYEMKGIAMPDTTVDEEECVCESEDGYESTCVKCSKPEEPPPEKPFERSGDAQRTLMDLMTYDQPEKAGMLIKDKQGNDTLFSLTKDDARGVLVPTADLVTSNYLTVTTNSIFSYEYSRSVYCPNIVMCSAKISVDVTSEVPSVNYKMTPEDSFDTCVAGNLPVGPSLCNFVKKLRHTMMPSLNAFVSHSTALYDTTNSSYPVFKVNLPEVHKDFTLVAIQAYCLAWDINQEEQDLCRQVVDRSYAMGLSVGLKTDDYDKEDTYYSSQGGYYEDLFASLSEEDAVLRYYFSAPFFMLRSMTHKERMYALNDMLKMEKKVIDHVLAKLMHLISTSGKKADSLPVSGIYRKIMGELPRIYWNDLLPGMFNNSIVPYKNETDDDKDKNIVSLTALTYSAYNGKRFSFYKYVPVPRLASYPEDKFYRKILLNVVQETPSAKLDALDVEARSSVRNNMQVFYYCMDTSLVGAWKDYKASNAKLDENHFEGNNNFTISTVPQIKGMLTYIEDGDLMYHKYGDKHGMVPITGNIRNRYKKALLNHAIEETIDIDEKMRVAGVSLNDTENDLLCDKELPKKLETYRIKKGAALIQLGKVLGHCIGNYASSSKGEYLFFRYKTVCARVDKDFKSVLECFDAHNKRTVKAKAFEKFLHKSMSLVGTAPARESAPYFEEVKVGYGLNNGVVFNDDNYATITTTGINNFGTTAIAGLGKYYVIKDTVLE